MEGADGGGGGEGGPNRMKKAEGQHKDIMDTIRQIELMEKRWREAEANRHMERALELEKRKLRGGLTTPSAEHPKVVAGGLRVSAMPSSQLLRPGSIATASHALADSSPRPVSMLAPMSHHQHLHHHHLQPQHSHSQPSFPAVGLTSGQSAAAVVQTGPHHGSTIGGGGAGAAVGAQSADEMTLENLALRRQLQSVTQENLQLKKEITSASEEIARLMAKVDELSRQWAKSSPRVIRRPTTVMLTPRAIATSGDGPANGGQAAPHPPSRLSRKVLLVDQKLRFSEQQIPVSVISAPQDEWRQTLKARRRISIVPKRFIHGTGRKWKPPSLLGDEIDSLDDNWKLLFGNEELESVSTKLQMRLRDENLMFAGLERLLKSYEKIEDQAGVDKTRRELADRRAKIDLKTRVFEEMLEKKQEMLHALDSVPPPDSETVDTHTLSSSSSGVDNSHSNNENDDDQENEDDDDEEEVEWVEWDEEEVEWVEQQQPPRQPTPTSSSSPTSGGAAALSPLRTAGAPRPLGLQPTSPASTAIAGVSSIPRTASGTPVSPGRASPQKGAAARPVSSFAHFGSSPSLAIRPRVAASPSPSPTQSPAKPSPAAAAQQTYAAAAAASSSPSTSSNNRSPSKPALSTRASSRSGLTPPSTPLPPVPSGAAAAGIGAKTAAVGVRAQPAPRPASSFTPSSSSSAAITARSALKPALPVKPASLTSSPSSSPYSSPSNSHTSVPTHHRPALGSASSSSSSLGGRLTPGGGSSPSSSPSSVFIKKGPPPSPPGSGGGARAPITAAQPTYGSAVVTHDFVPESQDELALTRGEKVTLRERIDDNWWEGEVRGQVGIFPHAFIQVLSLPAASSSS